MIVNLASTTPSGCVPFIRRVDCSSPLPFSPFLPDKDGRLSAAGSERGYKRCFCVADPASWDRRSGRSTQIPRSFPTLLFQP